MRSRIAVLRRPRKLIRDAGIVTKVIQVRGSRPARVLPFTFGREPIFVSCRQTSRLAFALRDRRAIIAGVEERHLLPRPVGVAGNVARVPSHDRRIFRLRHLMFPHPEVAGNGNGKLDAHERARLDRDHVGQRHQRDVLRPWRDRRFGALAFASELKKEEREHDEDDRTRDFSPSPLNGERAGVRGENNAARRSRSPHSATPPLTLIPSPR